MNRLFLHGLVFGIVFLSVGCWSNATDVKTNVNNNGAIANSNANLSTAPGENPQNSTSEPLTNVTAEDSLANKPPKNNSDAGNQTADPNSVKTSRVTNGVPAPENSFVSTVMNDQGIPIETRVFQNHPTLIKVERTHLEGYKTSTRVFLRDGRVLPLEHGKIRELAAAPTALILDSVGVKPPPNADSSDKKDETEKRQ